MKLYEVTVPFAGYCVYEIEAKSKDEAIEIAFDRFDVADAEESEPLREYVKGNICYVPSNYKLEVIDCGEVE